MERYRDREQAYREKLLFDIPQPSGEIAQLDFSTYGERGDVAFEVTKQGQAKPERYYAYWTAESGMFLQIAAAWLQVRSPEQRRQDADALGEFLRDVEMVAEPTDQGEGKFSQYRLRTELNQPGAREEYPMFGGSQDDVFVVDTSDSEEAVLQIDRDWDGERRRYDVIIPADHLWQVMAGMIGRSYSVEGRSYPTRTRFSTAEYKRAANVVFDA